METWTDRQAVAVGLCRARSEHLPFLPSFLFCMIFSSFDVDVNNWNNSSDEDLVTLKGPEMAPWVGDCSGWWFSIQDLYSETVVTSVSYHTKESSSLSNFRRSFKEGVSTCILCPCFLDLVQYQSTCASRRKILYIKINKTKKEIFNSFTSIAENCSWDYLQCHRKQSDPYKSIN